jgi:hypothetical protein
VRALPGFALLLWAAGALAQSPGVTEPAMDEIVVTGEFPGPGLWKVTLPQNPTGHVLWIVGDPWPLPEKWSWKSREIEATAAASQEILLDVGVTLDADEKIGVFRGMTYLPAILKARRNPDDARLADVLPEDLYARWLVQKKRYLGRETGVERWRPLFAADKLRQAAFDELDMSEGGVVRQVVEKLAKKRRIPVTSPKLKFEFKRSELRSRIKEFSRESLADTECFRLTLDLTEALARRDVEQARARAWATGDLAALAALPELPSPYLSCIMAVMNAQVARDLVPADVRERAASLWLENVRTRLSANASTFAVVSFPKLIRPDGYLDLLRAQGFVVEAPR